ncbi:DNA repair protein RecN [Fervidicella metallireducens AeB]|uniref:DNA repair protein RecN n=1 Tax=Fervidicella metallireducens AeB TaxID=1403537 RepID=A0A017RYP6_9CLOT|nr:DNA repair protein RecN [Fervidicella metallireducens]EYE89706.1 DNA repair protein RecN [Fervidicella metallireducens AeB]
MLLELHIKNFALIDEVKLRFDEGLNILTGETGAGKSILIDSVNFLLGDKQNRDIIRTGEENAFVEGVFEVKGDKLINILKENGIEYDDLLIITREINQSGRSISRINGRTVTLNLLKQIGELLIDIHGQHEHQSLLDEGKHIHILDSFCVDGFKQLKSEYNKLFADTKEIEGRLQKLKTDEQYKLRRIDLLSFQINEITEAQLKLNEDIELEKRKNILVNAEKIVSTLSIIYNKLYKDEETECAYDRIGTSLVQLESIAKYDEKISNAKESLEEVYYKIEDVIETLRDYLDEAEFNPEELNEIEIRLDTINKLKKKYGNSIGEILKYNEEITEELSNLQKSEELTEELERSLETNLTKLEEYAKEITKIRQQTGDKLKIYIENELKYLGMERAEFKVQIEETAHLNENGKNKVCFLITANPGEPLRALSKVASGGEMSRIMLAIKSVVADVDSIPTLIFDEIDTGISGRTAQAVAEKMCLISRKHQIFCVTHLPQIASMADNHYKIQKLVINNKTTTTVNLLNKDEKVNELSRMLGGAIVTETTKNHAKEMLELADSLKTKI